MAKFCANITFLFKELPFLERFQAAADAGFDGVEVLFPYDDPAPHILRALNAAGLPLALINAPPPNYTGGPRGYAATPGGTDRFQRDFRRVLRYADMLRPQHIHIMAGVETGDTAFETYVENLKWAADQAPSQSLTIEPLCAAALPGYFLNNYDLAVEVLDAVGADNLGLQFDSFHAQMLTGNAVKAWAAFGPRVSHVQIGDAPDRGAPGSGEVDFDGLFMAIGASGYKGWISGEYNTGKITEDSLGWMKRKI